jgi:hypothetical protein
MSSKSQKYQMTTKKKGIEKSNLRILLGDKIDMSVLGTFEREQKIFMQKS